MSVIPKNWLTHIGFILTVCCGLGLDGCGEFFDNGREISGVVAPEGDNSTEVYYGAFITVDEKFTSVIEAGEIAPLPPSNNKSTELPAIANPAFCREAWKYYDVAHSYIYEKVTMLEKYPSKAFDFKIVTEINAWARKIKERLDQLRSKLISLAAGDSRFPQDWYVVFDHAEAVFDQALAKYNSAVKAGDAQGVYGAAKLLTGDLDLYLFRFLNQRCPMP